MRGFNYYSNDETFGFHSDEEESKSNIDYGFEEPLTEEDNAFIEFLNRTIQTEDLEMKKNLIKYKKAYDLWKHYMRHYGIDDDTLIVHPIFRLRLMLRGRL